MPQLAPFYFVNQAVFAFFLLSVMVFFFTVYFLPSHVRLYTSRLFLLKI